MFEWIKGNVSRKRRDFGNYKFILKSQPDIIDSSSTISLIAYSNGFGNATIPCVYRWSIIKNGVRFSRPQFKGTTYKCEPSDVGGVIEAEVESTDMEYAGTAIVQFNAVEMDPNIKPQVQQSLVAGAFSTTIHIIQGIEQRQCQIKISQQSIRIKHNYSQASFQFQYSVNEPQTQCLIKSSSGMVVNFMGKYQSQVGRFVSALFDYPFKGMKGSVVKSAMKDLEYNNGAKCIQLKFPSHGVRDVFLFVWRALAVKKQSKLPPSSSSLARNEIATNTTIPTRNNNLSSMSEIQSLKTQLLIMSQLSKQHSLQRSRNLHQIQKLKLQIKTIITNYTVFIAEKFHHRTEYSNNTVQFITDKEDGLSKKMYKTLENQNNHLNSRIYALTKQIDTIRFQALKTQSAGQSIENISLHHLNSSHQANNYVLGNSIKAQQHTGKSINCTPFSKKKTTDTQSQDIINLLQDCDTSRISYLSEISSIHHGDNKFPEQNKLSDDNEMKQLQERLQRSYYRIRELEGQLWKARVELNSKNQTLTHSVVNVTGDNVADNRARRIACNSDHHQLHKSIQHNKPYVRNLASDFDMSRCILRSQSLYQPNSSVSIIRTQKKQPCFDDIIGELQITNQQLLGQKQVLIKRIEQLVQRNKRLGEENQRLRKQQPQIGVLQGRVRSLQEEVVMYQKNLDALNRSQQFNIESSSFSNQQIEMLKKQNDFLTNQNEKLTKACQKYMAQAKQSCKLRLQLTKMRSRIISEKLC